MLKNNNALRHLLWARPELRIQLAGYRYQKEGMSLANLQTAEFWAQARLHGQPTAGNKSLDVIIAQAFDIINRGEKVVSKFLMKYEVRNKDKKQHVTLINADGKQINLKPGMTCFTNLLLRN